jgi:hypothetical protein
MDKARTRGKVKESGRKFVAARSSGVPHEPAMHGPGGSWGDLSASAAAALRWQGGARSAAARRVRAAIRRHWRHSHSWWPWALHWHRCSPCGRAAKAGVPVSPSATSAAAKRPSGEVRTEGSIAVHGIHPGARSQPHRASREGVPQVGYRPTPSRPARNRVSVDAPRPRGSREAAAALACPGDP